MKGCRWCGRFVRKDQEPTVRTLEIDGYPRRTVRQTLCPECSASWSSGNWTKPPDYSLPIEDR